MLAKVMKVQRKTKDFPSMSDSVYLIFRIFIKCGAIGATPY